MVRQRRISTAVLLIVLLLTLCLFSPTIADTKTDKSSASTTSTSSSKSPAKPSSASPSSQTPSSDNTPTPSATDGTQSSSPPSNAKQQRLERKQKRQEAGKKRVEQQTKKVSEKAKKLTKKYSEQRKKRQDKDNKRQARQQKVKERSDAYWTTRKQATLPTAIEKGTNRLNKISQLAATTPLVSLKERQFEELVVGCPRPYWLLVSLTALSKKYECKICELAHNAFTAVAPLVTAYSAAITNVSNAQHLDTQPPSYNTLLSFNASIPAAQREQLQREHDDRAKRDMPMYVVELDIDNARNVFNVLQLSTAPVIFLLPPSFAPKAPAMSNLLTGLGGRYKFVPQSLDLTARTFIDFINGHLDGKLSAAPSSGSAGIDGISGVLAFISNKVSGFQPVILIYFSIILASLAVFFLVSIASYYWRRRAASSNASTDAAGADKAVVVDANQSSILSFFLPSTVVNTYNLSASSIASLNFYQLPRLLRTLPLIVAGITFYLFCVSGGMFTVIKDTDSGYSVSSTGQWEFRQWISNQYMDQTVIESTVLATLYLTLAALFILLNSRTFYRPSSSSSSSASAVLGWVSSVFVSPLWILLLGVFVYLQLVNVYSKKNSYNWGVNWQWLKQVDWKKTIPSPVFHKYLHLVWAEVQKRLI